MASSINNKLNKKISFINDDVINKNKETDQNYNNQIKNINSSIRNDNFIIDNSDRNNSIYRINNSQTIIGDTNFSNPLIIPQESNDLYLEYLQKRNLNSLNFKVNQQHNYINIDSSVDIAESITNFISLDNNSLTLTNETNVLSISVPPQHINNFKIGNKITLQGLGLNTYSINVEFSFTNNSNIVETNIPFTFTKIVKFYKILLSFNNFNTINNYFHNIPMSAINNVQNIIINNNKLSFKLPITFHSNSTTSFSSNGKITSYNISNIPISIINASNTSSKTTLNNYHIIQNIDYKKSVLYVNLPLTTYSKTNTVTFGNNIQIGTIDTNYSSNYVLSFNLNKRYENIALIRIISSEITIFSLQNENVIINTSNNLFYWNNLNETTTYSVFIRAGYYSYEQLKNTLTEKINNTLRTTNENIDKKNYMELDFQPNLGLFQFKSFTFYNLPLSLVNLSSIDGNYIITIQQDNNTLNVGDTITIFGAIDYFTISKTYINGTHTVSNISSYNTFDIKLSNINLITDVGNTFGGYSIVIKENNSFQLLFDKNNTIGSILGFKYVGSNFAVTSYSSSDNNYTINNSQPYIYTSIGDVDVEQEFDLNFSYILLQCEKLNVNYNPYNTNYFYKFQTILDPNNNVLYNTFVDAPLYFDPLIDHLDKLVLEFVTPDNKQINYKLFKYSFTLEIVTISNSSENTNLNIGIGRI